MEHDGRAVANFVLDECEKLGLTVSQLSLQKLVYFCHAWHLVEFGEPLVKQQFEAWEFGPVLPYLYREFRHLGRSPILERSKKLNKFTGQKETAVLEIESQRYEFLKRVIGFYARLPASKLVELSHTEDGPWSRVWMHAGKINPGMRIDNANILRYYSTIPRAAKVQ